MGSWYGFGVFCTDAVFGEGITLLPEYSFDGSGGRPQGRDCSQLATLPSRKMILATGSFWYTH